MKKSKNVLIFRELFRNVLINETTALMNYSTLTPEQVAYLDSKESDYIERWGVKRGYLKQHFDIDNAPIGAISLTASGRDL